MLLPCDAAGGARVAFAGHGDDGNSTRWVGPQSEALDDATTILVGTRPMESARYCKLHYLVGPDAAQPTLLLRGVVTPAHSVRARAFVISSTLVWGGIVALDTPIDTSAVVTLTRDRATLFNGVNVDHVAIDAAERRASADDIARQVLRNLLARATVETAALPFTHYPNRPNNTYHD
jgi:hypothetical protein